MPLCPIHWIKNAKKRLRRRRKPFVQPPQDVIEQMYQAPRLRPVTLCPCIRDPTKSPPPKKVRFACDMPVDALVSDGPSAPQPIQEVLPLELLSMISEYLHTKDEVHKFRLVHRRFREAAWAVFGRTFDDGIFHNTSYSAGKKLVALANTEQIVPYVKRLNISTVYPDVQAGEQLTVWCLEKHVPGGERYNVDTIEPWLDMLLAEKMWTELQRRMAWISVLEKMTALEEIVIWSGEKLMHGPRLPYIDGKLESVLPEASDGGVKLWHLDAAENAMQVLEVLITLDDTTRHRIKIIKSEGATSMLSLPPTVSGKQPRLPTLTHLTLTLDFPKADYHTLNTLEKAETHLHAFLAGMPNLTNLRLDFPYENSSIFEHSIVAATGSDRLYGLIPRPPRRDSTAAPPSSPIDDMETQERIKNEEEEDTELLDQTPQPLHFPHLHTLHLSNLILHNHTTLTHPFLSLHASTLKHLTIHNIFGPSAESWRSFWDFLEKGLELERFDQITHSSPQQLRRLEGDPRTRWVRLSTGEVRRRFGGRGRWVAFVGDLRALEEGQAGEENGTGET
ncbi:hypothetical protein LTR78_010805 [Recurvomyces mirabilis]|uniref:F-box domain-containing protein n=1 Tax=Recurvomyces mirabilis TaxID=574656 RepID=A0AAE0WEX6_9PEZI|nr:hypothetical protein LTR78_010805 [Recurvomyces mirabilis]KAK5156330.1 hypothetical protein LTS14_005218 [Recurvomyces mirabilis]